MKQIALSNSNKVAIVDDDDFLYLKDYTWRLSANYVVTGHELRTMHHEIVGHPLSGFEIDHINRNPLDNRKSNLRFVTHSENTSNKGPVKSTSGYKGVYKKNGNYWAQTNLRKSELGCKYLGYFDSKVAAAVAYDNYAGQIYPGVAYQNFPNCVKERVYINGFGTEVLKR